MSKKYLGPNTRFSLSCVSDKEIGEVVSQLQFCLAGGLVLNRPDLVQVAERVKLTGPVGKTVVPITTNPSRVHYGEIIFSQDLHLGQRYMHVEFKPKHFRENVNPQFDARLRQVFVEPYERAMSLKR